MSTSAPSLAPLGGLLNRKVKMSHTVKSCFEIAEMTELGKQVYQIVEDGNPQGKYVIVEVSEWEEFEQFKAAQHRLAADVAKRSAP